MQRLFTFFAYSSDVFLPELQRVFWDVNLSELMTYPECRIVYFAVGPRIPFEELDADDAPNRVGPGVGSARQSCRNCFPTELVKSVFRAGINRPPRVSSYIEGTLSVAMIHRSEFTRGEALPPTLNPD